MCHMKKIRTVLLTLIPALACVAGAYPVYPPADGLEYSTQSVTFITPAVRPSSDCPICKP